MQTKNVLRTALGLVLFCGVANGDDSASGGNNVAFEDSFERSELGDQWNIVIPSFSIRNGRLLGHEEPQRRHVAVCSVPLNFRNGVFEFIFRMTDGESVHLVINDKNCEQSHAGHVCRVSFTSSQVRISDDRDGAFRQDLYKAFLDSGRTLDRREQLKGREELIAHPLELGDWNRVRIVLKDDQITVAINEESIGSLRSPGIAHLTKTDFGFAIKGNTLEFDDIRVSDVDPK